MDTETTTVEDVKITTLFVCKGKRFDYNDKTLQVVIQQTDDESALIGADRFFTLNNKSALKNFALGVVYSVETLGDNTIYPGTMKFVRLWNNEEDRSIWALEEKAAETQMYSVQRNKNAAKQAEIIEALEPLRQAYLRTNYQNREAMELAVLRYLRWGGKK
jgi:hypothetical protein